MTYTQTLAQTIKRLRTEQNITINRLSDMTGIDKAVISRIEHGKAGLTYENACMLLKALGKNIYIA